MNILGKHNADIAQFLVKRNKSHDGKEALLDLDIAVKQEEAARFGEDFEKLAFGTMRIVEAKDDDDSDTVAFLVDNVKPGRRIVFEKHRIALEGEVFEAQPKLRNVRTVDGERRVVVTMRVPIDTGRTRLCSELTDKVGKTIKIEFDPKQSVLAFPKKNGKDEEPQAQATT